MSILQTKQQQISTYSTKHIYKYHICVYVYYTIMVLFKWYLFGWAITIHWTSKWNNIIIAIIKRKKPKCMKRSKTNNWKCAFCNCDSMTNHKDLMKIWRKTKKRQKFLYGTECNLFTISTNCTVISSVKNP